MTALDRVRTVAATAI